MSVGCLRMIAECLGESGSGSLSVWIRIFSGLDRSGSNLENRRFKRRQPEIRTQQIQKTFKEHGRSCQQWRQYNNTITIPVNWVFAHEKNHKNHCSPPFGPRFSGLNFRVVEIWGRRVLGSTRFGVVELRGCQDLGLSRFRIVEIQGRRDLGLSRFGVVEIQGCQDLGLSSFGVVEIRGQDS